MNKRKVYFLCLIFLSVGLSSCGFHLRGSLDNLSSASLDGQKVYINIIKDEQGIESDIRRVLLLSNVALVKDPKDSKYQIFILNTSLDRYASGLDTNGRTNEYEFIMQVDFVMVKSTSILKDIKEERKSYNLDVQRLPDSQKVVEQNKNLKISRHYYFDTNDLVGKKTEENSLLNEMKNHLSLQLLQQFSAFNNQQNTKPLNKS